MSTDNKIGYHWGFLHLFSNVISQDTAEHLSCSPTLFHLYYCRDVSVFSMEAANNIYFWLQTVQIQSLEDKPMQCASLKAGRIKLSRIIGGISACKATEYQVMQGYQRQVIYFVLQSTSNFDSYPL